MGPLALTYRDTKGTPLTATEGDANMRAIRDRLEKDADVFDVRRFVSGLGTTVTQAAFISALDAMSDTTTSVLRFPQAASNITAPVPVRKAVRIEGDCPPAMYYDASDKRILNASGDFDVFQILTPGVKICNIGIAFAGNALGNNTAFSRGVYANAVEKVADFPSYDAQGGLPGSYWLENVSVWNARHGIWQDNGQEGHITGCMVSAFGEYGMRFKNILLPDGGDMVLDGNFIYSGKYASIAGIYGSQGGGVRITNTKWNGRGIPYYRMQRCVMADYTDETSILKITGGGNSMENFAETGVWLECTNFPMVELDGIEFAPYSSASACIHARGLVGMKSGNHTFRRTYSPNLLSYNVDNVTGFTRTLSQYLDFPDHTSTELLGANVTDYYSNDRDVTPATGGGQTPVPAESTFDDTFAPPAGNTYRWGNNSAGAGTMTANNGLAMQPGAFTGNPETNRAQYTTLNVYDMRGRTLDIEIAGIGNAGDTGAASLFISVGAGGFNSISNVVMAVQNNVLYGQFGDGSGFASTGFDFATMNRWRFTFDTNNTSFTLAYSANGTSYTMLYSGTLATSVVASKIYLRSLESDHVSSHTPTFITRVKLS